MSKQKKDKKKKKVKYDPNKHIVPIPYNRHMDAIDEAEAIALDIIENAVGRQRFQELEQELENGESNDLKDATWSIIETLASLLRTPQEQFEYAPYSLGDEDFQPSKNFYSPNNFDKPLGVIDDE